MMGSPPADLAGDTGADRSVDRGADRGAEGSGDPTGRPFGVYVHVPFCRHRCDYCAFATYTDRDHLMEAYAAWPDANPPTDEAVVIEAAGGRVRLVNGDPALMKLTYPEDFDMAEAIAGRARLMRVGQGVDAHRFGPGDGVWLCGVKIADHRTLVGHSDADAILGAIGEGDIGDHFPPTDPQWKGAPSHLFLTHAAELVRKKGGQLINIDVTLICERPRIKPHRQAMREKLAELLSLPVERISVKATTTEGMGYTGREEGLLAQAIACVETPA